MTNPSEQSDPALLARLGSIARMVDPAPVLAYEIGRSVFGLRRLDDQLAELVADSLTGAVRVRASDEPVRLLTFESSGVTIELQVTTDGDNAHLLGVVAFGAADLGATDFGAPGSGRRVELETAAAGIIAGRLDAGGRFEFAAVPLTLVRLRMDLGEGTVTTSWMQL